MTDAAKYAEPSKFTETDDVYIDKTIREVYEKIQAKEIQLPPSDIENLKSAIEWTPEMHLLHPFTKIERKIAWMIGKAYTNVAFLIMSRHYQQFGDEQSIGYTNLNKILKAVYKLLETSTVKLL